MLRRLERSGLIETARKVIAAEAEGLALMARALDTSFCDAVDALMACKGRVIVAGIGKSGLVARKIAATLSSTGTPAQFVHPAEASHGDLGNVMPGDVVVALSKSGESTELADLIRHAASREIPLIGISMTPGSTLMRTADVALALPDAAEACGRRIVPTTSTAMFMALGDALAIAMMKLRGFTPAHFRAVHPGGRLGAQLARVGDLMQPDPPLVPLDTPMSQALVEMSRRGFGVIGVTGADGTLAGVITDGDLRRNMAGLLERTAGEVMGGPPRTIGPFDLARMALTRMNREAITCLFVVDPPHSRKVVGLLHIHDCLRAGLGQPG